MSFALLLVVSAVAGAMGAMTGLGGGFILIPVLTASGVDIKHAIAASILSGLAISSSAASNYVKGHLASLRVSVFLEMFAISGAVLGASVAVIARPQMLLVLCGLLLCLLSLTVVRQRPEVRTAVSKANVRSRWLQLRGSYYDTQHCRTITYSGARPALSGALMFGTGLIAGLLGIGSSVLSVLIQHVIMKLPPKVAVTTSNLILGSMTLAGASIYLEAHLIEMTLAIPIILGSFLGAGVGSQLFIRMPNRLVQNLLVLVVLTLGIQVIWRGLRGW